MVQVHRGNRNLEQTNCLDRAGGRPERRWGGVEGGSGGGRGGSRGGRGGSGGVGAEEQAAMGEEGGLYIYIYIYIYMYI